MRKCRATCWSRINIFLRWVVYFRLIFGLVNLYEFKVKKIVWGEKFLSLKWVFKEFSIPNLILIRICTSEIFKTCVWPGNIISYWICVSAENFKWLLSLEKKTVSMLVEMLLTRKIICLPFQLLLLVVGSKRKEATIADGPNPIFIYIYILYIC